MIKNILFDFDDVLAYHTEPQKLRSLLNVAEQDLDAVTSEVRDFLKEESKHLPSTEDEELYMRKYFGLLLEKLNSNVALIEDLLEYHFSPKRELYEGVLELLGDLQKKYKLGMVSNAFPSRRIHELRKNGITKFIPEENIFLSAEIGVWKPNPGIFTIALERLGINGEETVFIDDRLQYLKAAEKAGIKYFIHVSHSVEQKEHPTIKSIIDLPKVIGSLSQKP
jgi:putative hydrolase of the HAD superfamily